MIRFVLASALIAGLTCALYADDNVAELTDEEIEALVSQLASPNKPPKISGPSRRKPVGYDEDAQRKVRVAFQRLGILAPRSFPFLFEHLDDKRYSFTENSGDIFENYSVGRACRIIIVSHLQPDVSGMKEGGSSYWTRPDQPDYLKHHKLFEPKSAKVWWESRSELSMRELQVEVREWILKEEEKSSKSYSDEDRRKVQIELEKLQASDTPLPAKYPFPK